MCHLSERFRKPVNVRQTAGDRSGRPAAGLHPAEYLFGDRMRDCAACRISIACRNKIRNIYNVNNKWLNGNLTGERVI